MKFPTSTKLQNAGAVMEQVARQRRDAQPEANSTDSGKNHHSQLFLSNLPSAPTTVERKHFASFSARSPIDRILKKKGLAVFQHDEEAKAHEATSLSPDEAADPAAASEPKSYLTETVATRFQLRISSINLTSTVGRALLAKLPVTFLVAIELRSCCLVDSALEPLQTCPRLRYLSLASNGLRRIPPLGHMKALQFLDLGANDISSLAGLHRQTVHVLLPRSLRHLCLLDNPIAEDSGRYRPILSGLMVQLLAIDCHVVSDEERLDVLFDAPYCAGHPGMRLHTVLGQYPTLPPEKVAEAPDAWELSYCSGAPQPVSPRSKLAAEATRGALLERRLDLQLRCLQRHYACTNPVPMLQRLFRRALAVRRERLARLPPRSVRLLVRLQATVRRFLLLRQMWREMDLLLLAGADKQDLMGGVNAGGGASEALQLSRKFHACVIVRWWRALGTRRRAIAAARVIQRAVRWSVLRRKQSLAFVVSRGYEGVVVTEHFEGEVVHMLVRAPFCASCCACLLAYLHCLLDYSKLHFTIIILTTMTFSYFPLPPLRPLRRTACITPRAVSRRSACRTHVCTAPPPPPKIPPAPSLRPEASPALTLTLTEASPASTSQRPRAANLQP